jgi:hypothetical protein
MLHPLTQMEGFWVCFYSCKLYTLLVLQWWFCNKLGFGDYGGFAKLRGKGVVYGLLISREI